MTKKFPPYNIEIDGSLYVQLVEESQKRGGVAWPSWQSAFDQAAKDQAKYEEEIYDLLGMIDTPGNVGQLILQELPPKKKVTIGPRAIKGGKDFTDAVDKDNQGPPKSSQNRGQPIPGSAGTGSDVLMQFGPGAASGCGTSNTQNALCIASQPHEVLHHELVHALRMAQGRFQKVSFDAPDKKFGDTEEFWAILLTNIYISGWSSQQPKLRRDHDSTDAQLPKPLASSKGFLTDSDYGRLVKDFCTLEETALAKKIAALTAPKFNPIKEFMTGSGR